MHRTISHGDPFDINPGGEDLLAYCVSEDLNFCNVGNKNQHSELKRMKGSRLNPSEPVCVGPNNRLASQQRAIILGSHVY